MSQYIEAIGRRKTAAARVRLTEDKANKVIVNDKELKDYFPVNEDQMNVMAPFDVWGNATKFSVTVKVEGGGVSAQSDAVRHGIARALTRYDETTRTVLKQAGFLKRDPRKKERKKPGLKKARKAAQWSKR